MAKKEKGVRKKTRVSSSNLARSQLQNTNFSLLSSLSPFYNGSDGEMSITLKGLAKRDLTTKLKAVESLIAMVPRRTPETLVEAMPHICFELPRLALSNERRIREGIINVIMEVAKINKKILKAQFSIIVGYVWELQFDPSKEIKNTAKALFDFIIPKEKQSVTLAKYSKNIFTVLSKHAFSAKNELTDPRKEDSTEAEERYSRVVSSALNACSNLMKIIPVECNDSLDFSKFFSKVFLNELCSSSLRSIRGACYAMAISLVKFALPIVKENVSLVLKMALKALLDEDSSNTVLAWSLFITLSRAESNIWNIKTTKTVLPRLKKLISARSNGNKLLDMCLFLMSTVPAKPDTIVLFESTLYSLGNSATNQTFTSGYYRSCPDSLRVFGECLYLYLNKIAINDDGDNELHYDLVESLKDQLKNVFGALFSGNWEGNPEEEDSDIPKWENVLVKRLQTSDRKAQSNLLSFWRNNIFGMLLKGESEICDDLRWACLESLAENLEVEETKALSIQTVDLCFTNLFNLIESLSNVEYTTQFVADCQKVMLTQLSSEAIREDRFESLQKLSMIWLQLSQFKNVQPTISAQIVKDIQNLISISDEKNIQQTINALQNGVISLINNWTLSSTTGVIERVLMLLESFENVSITGQLCRRVVWVTSAEKLKAFGVELGDRGFSWTVGPTTGNSELEKLCLEWISKETEFVLSTIPGLFINTIDEENDVFGEWFSWKSLPLSLSDEFEVRVSLQRLQSILKSSVDINVPFVRIMTYLVALKTIQPRETESSIIEKTNDVLNLLKKSTKEFSNLTSLDSLWNELKTLCGPECDCNVFSEIISEVSELKVLPFEEKSEINLCNSEAWNSDYAMFSVEVLCSLLKKSNESILQWCESILNSGYDVLSMVFIAMGDMLQSVIDTDNVTSADGIVIGLKFIMKFLLENSSSIQDILSSILETMSQRSESSNSNMELFVNVIRMLGGLSPLKPVSVIQTTHAEMLEEKNVNVADDSPRDKDYDDDDADDEEYEQEPELLRLEDFSIRHSHHSAQSLHIRLPVPVHTPLTFTLLWTEIITSLEIDECLGDNVFAHILKLPLPTNIIGDMINIAVEMCAQSDSNVMSQTVEVLIGIVEKVSEPAIKDLWNLAFDQDSADALSLSLKALSNVLSTFSLSEEHFNMEWTSIQRRVTPLITAWRTKLDVLVSCLRTQALQQRFDILASIISISSSLSLPFPSPVKSDFAFDCVLPLVHKLSEDDFLNALPKESIWIFTRYVEQLLLAVEPLFVIKIKNDKTAQDWLLEHPEFVDTASAISSLLNLLLSSEYDESNKESRCSWQWMMRLLVTMPVLAVSDESILARLLIRLASFMRDSDETVPCVMQCSAAYATRSILRVGSLNIAICESLIKSIPERLPESITQVHGALLLWREVLYMMRLSQWTDTRGEFSELLNTECVSNVLDTCLMLATSGLIDPSHDQLDAMQWGHDVLQLTPIKNSCNLNVVAPSAFASENNQFETAFFGFVVELGQTLPSRLRQWFMSRPRRFVNTIRPIFNDIICPVLIQRQLATARDCNDDELSVRVLTSARQVFCDYESGEATLSLSIELPALFPLRCAQVKQTGVGGTVKENAQFQISMLLTAHNKSLAEAMVAWRNDVDKRFEGIEPCLICYSVLHPSNKVLPKMVCKTCSNNFHSSCLHRWFNTSNKSQCPMCQQNWVS
eukprot:TRINITY_DN337535_c0_g1_i1.p1 TRINITY_DN337535_c0_g1~~TRINITY_DN337535_c0_g1_i1.p1  ORF type:complete len:1699 (+),score=453.80 TRINITY_DN337535_c0_g1_i1:32-5128(+)